MHMYIYMCVHTYIFQNTSFHGAYSSILILLWSHWQSHCTEIPAKAILLTYRVLE